MPVALESLIATTAPPSVPAASVVPASPALASLSDDEQPDSTTASKSTVHVRFGASLIAECSLETVKGLALRVRGIRCGVDLRDRRTIVGELRHAAHGP